MAITAQMKRGYIAGVIASLSVSTYVLATRFTYKNYDIDGWHFVAIFSLGLGVLGLIDLYVCYKNQEIFVDKNLSKQAKINGTIRATINGTVALIAFLLIIIGQQHTTATNASLIIASNPVPTAIFAWLILGLAITKRQLIVFPFFLAGLYIAVAGFTSIELVKGDIMIIIAAITIAFSNAFSRTAMKYLTPRAVTSTRACLGLLVPIGVFIATGETGIPSIGAFVLAFFSGFMLWVSVRAIYASIYDIGTNNAVILAQLHLIFTPIAASFLLNEKYQIHIALGSAIMLISIFFFTHSFDKPSKISS